MTKATKTETKIKMKMKMKMKSTMMTTAARGRSIRGERIPQRLTRLWLLTLLPSLGCGPYFESPQFGWSTSDRHTARNRSATLETALYVEQIVPGSGGMNWRRERWKLPDDELPLEAQAEEIRAYLAEPHLQRLRGTAVRRLALIESFGATHPEEVAALIRSNLDATDQLLALPLMDFVALETGWTAYAGGDYAGALAFISGALEDRAASGADPHLRYLEARALSRLDPFREAELFAAYLEAHPGSPWAADARGWYAHGLLHLGRGAEALEQYARICANPASAHLHRAARLSLGRVLKRVENRSSLDEVIAGRSWLGAAVEFHDAYRRLRHERDPEAASAAWQAFAETVRREYGQEPPHRAIDLAAIHAYEHGDYDGAIRLWESIPAHSLEGRSMRYYGIALAAQSALAGSASLELAAQLRASRTLSNETERWVLGEMGRRLLENGRKIEALLAFHRGRFARDWQTLLDTSFSAREIRQLRRRGGASWTDAEGDELDLYLGRQLAREGRYGDAARVLAHHPGTARTAREIDELIKAYDRAPSAEAAFRVAEAFYSARSLLQQERYVGWRASYALGYQALGLTNRDFGQANNFWTALKWFDHVQDIWPEDPRAAEALYRSAICAFWTSDIDWYWGTMGLAETEGRSWGYAANPRFIEDGASRLRRLLEEHPDFVHGPDAERRLAWAEEKLARDRR